MQHDHNHTAVSTDNLPGVASSKITAAARVSQEQPPLPSPEHKLADSDLETVSGGLPYYYFRPDYPHFI